MGEPPLYAYYLVIFGTITLVLLAGGVVLFFMNYQRKIIRQQEIQHELELAHQKTLLDSVLRVQEQEQRRIAMDLHDEIGPVLSLIKLNVEALPRRAKALDDLKTLTPSISVMLRDAITEIRRLSHNLMPVVVNEKGLVAALTQVANGINSNGQLRFVLTVDEEVDQLLSKNEQVALYRMVQELLQNTLKHAQAHEVQLSVQHTEQVLCISYEDDGRGFDQQQPLSGRKGLGMSNLTSRLQLLGATFSIRSAPGQGFALEVEMPLRHTGQPIAEAEQAEKQLQS